MPEGEVSQLQNTPNEDYWADSNENLDLETSGGFRNDPRRAEANIASRSVKSGARITIAPLLSNVKSRSNPLLGSPTDLEQSALHPVYPQTKPVSIRDWGCLEAHLDRAGSGLRCVLVTMMDSSKIHTKHAPKVILYHPVLVFALWVLPMSFPHPYSPSNCITELRTSELDRLWSVLAHYNQDSTHLWWGRGVYNLRTFGKPPEVSKSRFLLESAQ